MRVLSVSGGEVPTRPSDKQTAARHIGSMKQPGLAWVARQMRRQAASAAASEPRPSGVLPSPSGSEIRLCNVVEEEYAKGVDAVRYGYRGGPPCVQSSPGDPKGEHPPMSHATHLDKHVQQLDYRSDGAQVHMVDIPGIGYGNRSNGQAGSELVSRVDNFGSMAPCWRLIESAQAYMDKDQLQYMRALVLAQVRKPMTREQLLDRAEGCLQEQEKIFDAFVKMFDFIDRPQQVPRYPTTRPLHPRAQSTSFCARRSPEAQPIHASRDGLPPSQPPARRTVPAPRTDQDHVEDSYPLLPANDNGQRGVPIILPCGCAGMWPPGGLATNPSS